jgi:hypothetical protein
MDVTPPSSTIEGYVVHKTNNALRMSFQDGPGDPCAVGVQGAGDGKGKKLAILFGFANGGSGNHVLTWSDGTVLRIASKEREPTVLTLGDGSALATIERGDESTARMPDGSPLLHFGPDPVEDRTPDLFRIVVTGADGGAVGTLDVIRKVPGWTLSRAVAGAADLAIWWDRAGQPLPVPILGTRLATVRPLTPVERDVLVCACVDLAIGLRPYIASMN